ncbi:MAG: mannose-1-phosphate guanylyltransferase/mannose-6-phosphate isomerase [Desulfuromonadales bacterium]
MLIPVILSGGAGTRLWPLSRELYPKQLLPLIDERTMLQETVLRLEGLEGRCAPVVVCNEAHRFMVAEQLRQIGQDADAVILEPVGRNTAPAVAVAAMQAIERDPEAVILVLPADHVIRNAQTLCNVVSAGLDAVQEGALLTFGIVPTAPETGYGYIKRGAKCEARKTRHVGRGTRDAQTSPRSPAPIYHVDQFVEKPDQATAQDYLDKGNYYWNSGMFMFKAADYLAELEKHAPEMLAACRKAWQGRCADLDFTRLDAEAFAACPADSIDYAVMEKTAHAVVIPLDAGWSDVGSWAALWAVGETVVEQFMASPRHEHLLPRRVKLPWGAYVGLVAGDGFLVKRITVNPGARLSLQRHNHRAEHWIVVRGIAEVVCENVEQHLEPNQSFYIPIGDKHRLANPGDEILEIIEVQTGSLLSEDDIERFDDEYGR